MTFKPGVSGNPSGRPRLDPKVKAMFQARGEEAFNVIAACLKDNDPKVRLSAAETLLERAYGKVPQAIVGDEDHPGVFDPLAALLQAIDGKTRSV